MCSECQLKGVIEDYLSVGGLRFICVLRHTCAVALDNAPVCPSNEVVFRADPVILINLCRLNVAAHQDMKT